MSNKLLLSLGYTIPKFWTDPETGLLCKCRLDAVKPDTVVDIKTTLDASTKAFARDAYNYGYHVQAAHYLQGVEATTGHHPKWYFLVIEKKPPYCIHIFPASAKFIEQGTFERAQLMEELKRCSDADAWPSYKTEELMLPAWAYSEAT